MAERSLEDVLSQSGVDPNLTSSIIADGWTRDRFALSAVDLDRFDEIIPELSTSPLSALQKANLRAAFKECQRMSIPEPASPSAPQPTPAPSSASGSWTETFAPKLEPAIIQSLKSKFLSSYPSELLTPDLMPSTRLLSLTYNQIHKKAWVWIPWKLRLSVTKSDELQGQRQSKAPKLEGISLHSLLVDDPPSIEVSNGSMGLHAIRSVLELHDRAIALCAGAHLENLNHLTQRVDADTNLRTPTVIEAQAADRQVWTTIAELVNDQQWTMDDAIHELTYIRHNLPSLLQLRPRMPKTMGSPGPSNPSTSMRSDSKGKGKSKSKKGGGRTNPASNGSPKSSRKMDPGDNCA